MFFSNEEYKKTMKDFLENHHGVIVKISDDDGKIFGYIFRAEANERDSKNIVFSIVPDFFYYKGHRKPVSTEIKYYGIKRILSKWEKVKEENYINLNDCIDDSFKKSIETDLTEVKKMYEKMEIEHPFDICNVSSFIHKNLKAIKKYYADKSDIKIIFL